MGQATPSFTMQESVQVLDEALRLLATPEQWTTGTWKCELLARDPKTGRTIREEDGSCRPRTDEKGRPVFAYCIEGAVNQAVINKFGPVRAKALGALNPNAPDKLNGLAYTNDDISCAAATDRLSVNDITKELYADEWIDIAESDRPAQVMNDSQDNMDSEYGDTNPFGYEDVIRVLTTKRDRLVKALQNKLGI